MAKPKKNFAIFFILLVGILVLGLSLFWRSSGSSGEYINPGSPKSPVVLNEDFFSTATQTASNITIEEVIKEASYPILLRTENGKPLKPEYIWINPQTVKNKVINGYSFRWSDRIQLAVDPAEKPRDIEEDLKQTMTPNVKGETRINKRLEVRGNEGFYSEKGTIKWESGVTYNYPAVISWTEPGTGEIPYLIYTLYGDCSIDKLKEIAENLKPFD